MLWKVFLLKEELLLVFVKPRKDYDDRRRRQAEGIKRAKAQGVYKGRPVDLALHQKIRELREKGFSIRKTADLAGCGVSTVQRALKG
ncbi:MAG: helix-turn-helix domain-containing protein [Pseudomonadota bacterium]